MANDKQATQHSPELRPTMSLDKKEAIEELFGKYINNGQIQYLKAGHLDVIENNRAGIGFIDPVQGKKFFDGFTSAGCFNVGRHNKIIMEALDEALDELDMGTFHMVSPAKVAFAKKLTSLAPGDLNRMVFAAGGGDAVDCAIKLARGATGRTQIISTVKAYHGHTGFALSANGKEHYRKYFEPLAPDFHFIPFGDLEAMKRAVTDQTAAILLEPIQGEAGIFPAENAYLQAIRKLCDEKGILLILDEIQTGFGRTGKLFACEHSGVVPDIMPLAKSIGGGLYPNAAVLYRDISSLVDFVEENPSFHPSTVGGSDIACRVSLRILEYMEENRLWENAEKQGAVLMDALLKLQAENPKIIREIRGRGMMIGIEYLHEFMGPMMADSLAKNGMFAAYSGNAPQVMRFMLPIVINDEELQEVIVAIQNAVGSMKMLLPFALPAAKIPPVLKLLNDERVQTVLFGGIRKVEDAINILLRKVGRAS